MLSPFEWWCRNFILTEICKLCLFICFLICETYSTLSDRLENRKKYLEKGERQKRTHRLCNLGGTIESLAPEFKDLTRTEMTELMEYIFSLPEVQRAVRHMAITHINQASRGKEQKADGTISSERHAD